MSARKIVQIAATMDEGDVSSVYALADDGTFWLGYWSQMQLRWRPLPPLPQPPAGDPAEGV